MTTDTRPAATALYSIPTALAALRDAPSPSGRVLSVYLDTSPDRLAGQAYLLRYRDQCKDLRTRLLPTEHAPFEAAAAQAERYLAEELPIAPPGIAVFASGQPGYLYSVPLPSRPEEHLRWSDAPEIAPLQSAVDDHERLAVVLFDKERARLFTIYLGAIEAQQTIVDEVPGKQATGDWFALSQARYARHHEDHVLRHAKRVITALMATLRTRSFDRLVLGGPPEALAVLRHHLPRPLRARLAGTLTLELFATDAEVLRAARAAGEAIERRHELTAVTELVDAATAPHTALGLAATVAALNDGRVHELLVADSFTGTGGQCESCGRFIAGRDRCAACDTEPVVVEDFREALVTRALDQGARVESVSGDAATLLQLHGGIGAWTRY
jgi:peptide chain release factor subunit 1